MRGAIPTAACRLSHGGGQVVREHCPGCGKPHYHSAGDPAEEPWPLLGHRVAHCVERELGDYMLERTEDEAERRQAARAGLVDPNARKRERAERRRIA